MLAIVNVYKQIIFVVYVGRTYYISADSHYVKFVRYIIKVSCHSIKEDLTDVFFLFLYHLSLHIILGPYVNWPLSPHISVRPPFYY